MSERLSSTSHKVIYFSQAYFPPGIENCGNLCYANSVFQCLLNHQWYTDRLREIADNHIVDECVLCVAGIYK